MYIPKAFREDDLEKLHKLMQEYSFAALVTQQDGVPVATHLPFLLDMERGQYGTLMAHMARANPQWRTFDSGQEALVIFQGPHAYISPSWYEVELSVPTWNYAAVHVYGYPRLIEDPQVLYSELKALIETHESQFKHPWPFALPADYTEKMMRGTVGFTLEITRIEGKYKLSQNRTPSERARVIAALETTHPDVAQLMKEREQSG